MRKNETCNGSTESAKQLRNKNDISSREKRKRKILSLIWDYYVTDPSGLTKTREEDAYGLLRENVYFSIIDKALFELDRRFSDEDVDVLCRIDALSPKSNEYFIFHVLRSFAEHYSANVDDLKLEIKQLSRLVGRKKDSQEFRTESLIDMLGFVKRYQDTFYEIKILL